jgi:hypothetical protein
MRPAVTRAPRSHGRSSAALAGSPCDARVAPLMTMPINKIGSRYCEAARPLSATRSEEMLPGMCICAFARMSAIVEEMRP